ncbi:hypothetical protein BN1723_000660, partial [Verticillium longisporum]
ASSFNQPHHCDTNLLTPISSASSPPLQQRSQLMSRYPSSTAPSIQQHTPPGTAKMYWGTPYDMGTAPSSQAASPMTMQPPTTDGQFEMGYILSEPSQSHHHHHHHKEDIPEPPEPYFGSFGVSSTEPEQVTAPAQQMHHHPYYLSHNMGQQQQHMSTTLAPSILAVKPEQEMDMDMQHHNMHRHIMPSPDAPSLHQTQPNHYRSPQYRSRSNEDLRMMHNGGYTLPPNTSGTQVRRGQPPPRVAKRTRIRGRQAPQSTGGREGTGEKDAPRSTAFPPSHGSSEPLDFKEGMPDTDKFLFELRAKYSDNKGKGMWDPITREYNERFKTQFDRAALQMKVSRAKSKWIQWHEKDDTILVEAARQVEQQYYRQVHLKFKELGGNPQADFNVGNIEMRMVELGLSHVWMDAWKGDAKMSTRRRRKLNERQRSTATTRDDDRGRQQLPSATSSSFIHDYSVRDDLPNSASSFATIGLSPGEREQVLDDIDTRAYKLEAESPQTFDNDDDSVGMGQSSSIQQGRRATKQACGEMVCNSSGNSRAPTGSPQSRGGRGMRA